MGNRYLIKRIISWLSCYNLTYDENDQNYKKSFNRIIKKQTNHLINELNRSKKIDKLIGCAAIILVGLCYQNKKNFINIGANNLREITRFTLDNSISKIQKYQTTYFLFKIFYFDQRMVQRVKLLYEHIENNLLFRTRLCICLAKYKVNFLFNGNHINENYNFDKYLKFHNYKFKNEANEHCG